ITSLASRAVKPASVTGAHPPGYPLRVISAQASAASGARTGRAGDSGGFRTRWALLISVAGGLALYASFPPAGLWPLAVLGPALLVLALTGRSLRGSFGCALVFGLVRVGRASRVRGGHLRAAGDRPAAAASPAVLAGRRGGLVGPGRGGAGPVALRLSLGPAGDEPVGRAGRPLGRVRRRAAAELPDRADRCHARPGCVVSGGRSPPDPPCSWGGYPPPQTPLGGARPAASRSGNSGAGAGGRAAACRPDRGRAHGPGGRDPGQRATGQEPPPAAERHPGHAEPRRRHAEAGRAGQGGRAASARPGDLAGERHRHRPVPEPVGLRPAIRGGGRDRQADPDRRGAE